MFGKAAILLHGCNLSQTVVMSTAYPYAALKLSNSTPLAMLMMVGDDM